MAIDPVCKMEVDDTSEYESPHAGKTVYFCCEECKREFDRNPSRYVSGGQAQR